MLNYFQDIGDKYADSDQRVKQENVENSARIVFKLKWERRFCRFVFCFNLWNPSAYIMSIERLHVMICRFEELMQYVDIIEFKCAFWDPTRNTKGHLLILLAQVRYLSYITRSIISCSNQVRYWRARSWIFHWSTGRVSPRSSAELWTLLWWWRVSPSVSSHTFRCMNPMRSFKISFTKRYTYADGRPALLLCCDFRVNRMGI